MNSPRGNHLHEGAGTNEVEFLVPREFPLGGPRAMPVRRTLPQKQHSLIGSWCFLNHYGPDLVPESGGMRVPRHPHTGLATASWLFTGVLHPGRRHPARRPTLVCPARGHRQHAPFEHYSCADKGRLACRWGSGLVLRHTAKPQEVTSLAFSPAEFIMPPFLG